VDPLILMDQPEDGWCESLGWVQATVNESEARLLLAEWCADEDGEMTGAVPDCGRARIVRLAPEAGDGDYGTWYPCDEGAVGALIFWEIPTA